MKNNKSCTDDNMISSYVWFSVHNMIQSHDNVLQDW